MLLILFLAIPFYAQNPTFKEMQRERGQRRANKPSPTQVKSPVQRTETADKTTLYGCILDSYGDYFNGEPGMFSFKASDANSFKSVKDGIRVYGGGTYGNGTYYGINFTESADGRYITFPSVLTLYDVPTWKPNKVYHGISFGCLASDLAYDPVSKNVYGVFWDAEYKSINQFGYIVYDTPAEGYYSSNIISTLPERMVSIACNSAGQIYTISVSGKLYSIDKATGAASLIGNTGVDKITPFYQSACFNMETGLMYWTTVHGDYLSWSVYEVDPATANSVQVADMGFEGTYNDDQITGLTTLQDVEVPNLPEKADSLNISFLGNSLDGQIKFILPKKNLKGENLTGNVHYKIMCDNAVTVEGDGTPGEKVEKNITVPTAGMHTFIVNVSVDGKESSPTTLKSWIGDDVPVAPASLNATVAGVQGGAMTVVLEWNKVTKGEHGGYIDNLKVNYVVNRLSKSDKKEIYVGSDTTFADKIKDNENAKYTYEVQASYNGVKSSATVSNSITVGSELTPPYSNNFDNDDALELWTILDANEDNSTWRPYNGMLAYEYNDKNPGDDYAVTPGLKLKAGNVYNINVTASNTYPDERVAVYVGKKPVKDELNIEVIAPTDITYEPRVHKLSGSFRPESDGIYYFAIKACSDFDCSTLYVDNFSVTEVEAKAPAMPENLTVKAGDKGALSAEIKFNAPTLSIKGAALESIDACVIERDGKEISRLTNINPGQEVTVKDDNGLSNGFHTYKVYAVLNSQIGNHSEKKVYIGIDVPGAVLNLKAVEDVNAMGTINVTWDAPSVGQNGGYIDPAKLTYIISVGVGGENKQTKATSYTDKINVSDKQIYQGYSVYAENEVGSGRNVWQTVVAIAGPAIIAPMYESFSDVTMKSGPWITDATKGEIGEARWTPCDGSAVFCGTQDNDNGVVMFDATKKDVSSIIQSPKVDISKLNKPQVSFWVYMTGKSDFINVGISADSKDYEALKTIYMNEKAVGWQRYTIDLSNWKNTKYIRIGFDAVASASNTDVTAIDNFAVSDMRQYDLGVNSIEVSEKVYTGKEHKLTMKMRNWGSLSVNANDYKILLYKNDNLIETFDGQTVGIDGIASFRLANIPTVFDPQNTKYKAVIKFDGDEDLSNNISKVVETEVQLPNYPTPDNVRAESLSKGVELNWNAPDLNDIPEARTTDSFESYEEFAINGYGDWKVYDKDGKKTIRITLNASAGPLNYPNAGEPMAFQVFNSESAGIPFTSWDAHTGSQMLAAFKCASPDGGTTEIANDDWLISPELSGKAQTISFYAKAGMGGEFIPENFEILYSTTSTEIEDFKKLGQTHDVDNYTGWKEFKADLPEGAKWFAIRCVSYKKFALLLDDFTFTSKGAEKEEMTLKGYNIYRDSVLMTPSPVETTSFTDSNPVFGSTYKYHVTAVYDIGESMPSEPASVVVTSVNGTENKPLSVKADEGMLTVDGIDGRSINVYSANGICVFSSRGKNTIQCHLPEGVYVIKVSDGQVLKVMMR